MLLTRARQGLLRSLGIHDENLGWLSLAALGESESSEVERVVRDCLIAREERDLPDTITNRSEALDYVHGLVALLVP